MLQIQNLERRLCRPTGHYRLTTGAPMMHNYMTHSNGFDHTATGKFAAKSNGEGEEETSVTSD